MNYTLRLEPIDAWFFRDGRPYNEGESNQTDVESLFPPNPFTLSGALRATIARKLGWDGRSPWTATQIERLGDGPFDTGELAFRGARILQRARQGERVLVPTPSHLVADRESARPSGFLEMGPQAWTDLGHQRLLVPPKESKEAAGTWVDLDGLSAILHGERPEMLVDTTALFEREPRVGICRDPSSRTTGEGAMYSPHYLRLKPGVALELRVDGEVADELDELSLLPFGGEARMAECRRVDPARELACPVEAIAKRRRLVAIFLSPADISVDKGSGLRWPRPGEALPGIEGARIIAASIGKAVSIGGWNGRDRQPIPLRPHAPAGAVYYLELDQQADLDRILAAHDTCIGRNANLGFGHVVFGAWPDNN